MFLLLDNSSVMISIHWYLSIKTTFPIKRYYFKIKLFQLSHLDIVLWISDRELFLFCFINCAVMFELPIANNYCRQETRLCKWSYYQRYLCNFSEQLITSWSFVLTIIVGFKIMPLIESYGRLNSIYLV